MLFTSPSTFSTSCILPLLFSTFSSFSKYPFYRFLILSFVWYILPFVSFTTLIFPKVLFISISVTGNPVHRILCFSCILILIPFSCCCPLCGTHCCFSLSVSFFISLSCKLFFSIIWMLLPSPSLHLRSLHFTSTFPLLHAFLLLYVPPLPPLILFKIHIHHRLCLRLLFSKLNSFFSF